MRRRGGWVEGGVAMSTRCTTSRKWAPGPSEGADAQAAERRGRGEAEVGSGCRAEEGGC